MAKDEAENVMIVDLVRNDLGRVCRPGYRHVPGLLAVEPHPGLVHLVSDGGGRAAPGHPWPQILDGHLPPGLGDRRAEVAALDIIRALEAGPRGPYCGAFGWVDADAGTAELAVGIRTFWRGTPTGTDCWPSAPAPASHGTAMPRAEWRETMLKAARLLAVAGDREVP